MNHSQVHIEHIRKARLCMKGTREWFAAQGWCWKSFRESGKPLQDFIDTGDPLTEPLIAVVLEESQHGVR